MAKRLPFDSVEHAQKFLCLSDKYPSGLEWKTKRGRREAGAMAGTKITGRHLYIVRVLGNQYLAHRIVYYLRTGVDPFDHDVIHGEENLERDNRCELHLVRREQRRTTGVKCLP